MALIGAVLGAAPAMAQSQCTLDVSRIPTLTVARGSTNNLIIDMSRQADIDGVTAAGCPGTPTQRGQLNTERNTTGTTYLTNTNPATVALADGGSYTITSIVAAGSPRRITYTPPPGGSGTQVITISNAPNSLGQDSRIYSNGQMTAGTFITINVTVTGPAVTPGAASGTTVGGSYSQANPASDGTAPYTYALASGAFPAGTTINTATGTVSGTPTTAGGFSYAVQATDSSGSPVTVTGATVSGTIAKGAQSITFAALADAALAASPLTLTATSSSSLTVSFTSATTGVCTVSGTTVTLLTAGTCTINANQAGDSNFNPASQVQRSFTVTATALAVTPGAASGTTVGGSYSQANPASGGVGPYTYALASGAFPAGTTVNTATGTVSGTPTTAGAFSYAVQATDSQGTPATATGTTVSGTIAKGAQTITFAPLATASLTASPLTLTATSSSGLTVGFTSATTGVCTVSGSTLTLLTPGTCTINADQAGDANFNAASQIQRSFAVTPAALAVTPGAASGTAVGGSFSQANPASGGTAPYTYALASGAFPAGTTVNTATGTVSGTPTTAGAFSYAVQATDSQGAPVTVTGTTVSGTIAKGAQTISFAPLADASLAASPLTLSATSSSGLTVSFTSVTTGVCTVSGTAVTLLTTGTCTINANQAGDSNFNPASQVARSFTVTALTSQSLSFTSNLGTVVVGATYTPTVTSTSGRPVTLSIAAGSSGVCTITGGVVTFIGVGSCVILADSAAGGGYGAAPQVTQTLTVVLAIAAIPTLSEWAMILFGALLAGGAALMIQRRRFTA